jgi:hypothetical protein
MIYEIRGHKVMLDSDLAMLYGIEAKRLNEAVKRNLNRFPEDFMFQITPNEFACLRSQFATSNTTRGGRRYMPYVFTEHGILMLSSVLNSEQAVHVNVQIMRTFVKMRQFALEHKELSAQIQELKHYFIQYAQDNNAEIDKINEAIDLLMDRTKPAQIGFKTKDY